MKIRSKFDALVHRERIGQFVSVGAIGAIIEIIILTILTGVASTDPLVAKAIGAETSISTMFIINDHWTFAGEGDLGASAFIQRWIKSHLVRIVGLSVSFVVLYVLTSHTTVSFSINGVELWAAIANVIGIGVGMVINYIAESVFTWDVIEVVNDV